MIYGKLLIAIVVYKKELSTLRLLSELESSDLGIDVLIYDNSPIAQSVNADWSFVEYFHAPNNHGVSTAYNHAFRYAKSNGKQIVLILDQDTNFKLTYIYEYLKCYHDCNDSYIYAPIICDSNKRKIYSPSSLVRFVGYALPYNKNIRYQRCFELTDKSVINSGLMIPLSIFEQINGFNDDIKLDFSDIYFIEKYKEINQSIIIVPIEMEHSLSGDENPDKNKELHRFKYYCTGAKEIARSLHVNTKYTCLRRMVRLMMKYYTVQPVITYIKYYLGEAKV